MADQSDPSEPANQAYLRKKAEEDARKWTCDCPPTGKQKFIATVVTLAQAVALAVFTASGHRDDEFFLRVLGFWIVTGFGGFVLYTMARRHEHWFLIGRHIEGPTLPKRVQRLLWEEKRRAGENPGPEPRDAKGVVKMFGIVMLAMAIGLLPVGLGILLAERTALGVWGFVVGLVAGFAILFLLVRSVEFARQKLKERRPQAPR